MRQKYGWKHLKHCWHLNRLFPSTKTHFIHLKLIWMKNWNRCFAYYTCLIILLLLLMFWYSRVYRITDYLFVFFFCFNYCHSSIQRVLNTFRFRLDSIWFDWLNGVKTFTNLFVPVQIYKYSFERIVFFLFSKTQRKNH